eukprot:TRINITY_DN2094_c0_g1_i1.p1 TRINITY_DN2094_c0_g1~~TRINITY_DN2094_c0_g1_i1.p1  ORF type:complete len:225 (-),score=57.33 TRINITY_DN2094_c0_g1_i1:84-758(-)
MEGEHSPSAPAHDATPSNPGTYRPQEFNSPPPNQGTFRQQDFGPPSNQGTFRPNEFGGHQSFNGSMGSYSVSTSTTHIVTAQYAIPYVYTPATKDFQFTLCSCCDECGLCCITCLCPCLTEAENNALLAERERECCDIFFACFNSAAICNAFWTRQHVRAKYGYPQNTCDDCCASLCCRPCILCQLNREIRYRTNEKKEFYNKPFPTTGSPTVQTMSHSVATMR